jgi:hypothetical protein
LRSAAFLGMRTFCAPLCLWYAYKEIDSKSHEDKIKEIYREVAKLPLVITAGIYLIFLFAAFEVETYLSVFMFGVGTITNILLLGGMNLWYH